MTATVQELPRRSGRRRQVDARAATDETFLVRQLAPELLALSDRAHGQVLCGHEVDALATLRQAVPLAQELLSRLEAARNALEPTLLTEDAQLREASDGR